MSIIDENVGRAFLNRPDRIKNKALLTGLFNKAFKKLYTICFTVVRKNNNNNPKLKINIWNQSRGSIEETVTTEIFSSRNRREKGRRKPAFARTNLICLG